MTEIRKNEFIELLDNVGLLYEVSDYFIKCEIENLGAVTYYPKKDRLQIDKENYWENDGFKFVKNIFEGKLVINEGYTDKAISIIEMKKQKNNQELRNEFAGLAMQSFLGNPIYFNRLEGNNGIAEPEQVAKLSFRMADAMLRERFYF